MRHDAIGRSAKWIVASRRVRRLPQPGPSRKPSDKLEVSPGRGVRGGGVAVQGGGGYVWALLFVGLAT